MIKNTYVHVESILLQLRDAMQIASRNGNVDMLSMLRSRGGNMFSRGPKGDTLLHLAALNGHVETMRYITLSLHRENNGHM